MREIAGSTIGSSWQTTAVEGTRRVGSIMRGVSAPGLKLG